ncbi:MAG TPA: AarF/ABC1/UbiB kinase family protein [Fibrobacteria bacterium]|nr:AarF/ABC1/UbiB kinase family protein [Fibrobacteria bacterium]
MALRLGMQAARKAIQSPFLSASGKKSLDIRIAGEQGKLLFKVFSQMKGVPLKLAQALSLEEEMLPEEIRKELAKSCYNVPPINRGLVRKILTREFGQTPEDIFAEFDYVPFAAASLGQVHMAKGPRGRALAVKLQYPGISEAIRSDLAILKTFSAYVPLKIDIRGAMAEVEGRLMEELDYSKEMEWTAWFGKHLRLPGVATPKVEPSLCAENILTTHFLPGAHLEKWLSAGPSQDRRDRVAGLLFRLFLHSVYRLRALHADPNPGNFLIDERDHVNLLDFGCVKRFRPEFTDHLAGIMGLAISGSEAKALDAFWEHGFIASPAGKGRDAATREKLLGMLSWIRRPYQGGSFDFSRVGVFFEEGRRLGLEFLSHNPSLAFSPEFVFLDRVRYGLYRIFQKMGARVDLRNQWESQG